jgi:hypothetical protein
MKATTFYILIYINTANGYQSIGKFFIGDNREIAEALFNQLQGDTAVDDKTMLTIELMETMNDLPINLHIKSCTLKELADNCCLITKELFKSINLEDL